MATFEMTGPDGATYHLDAPDERAALSAFSAFTGGSKSAPAPAEPVSVNNVVRSAATGVPIIGGLLNKADAATNATLAPFIEPFLSPSENDISRKGETWKERYGKSLAIQNKGDAKFEEDHPIIDTGAKLAGGAAAMVPAVAAAPGLLGATGGFAARTAMGAASNAAIGGADAAIRGGDPVAGALVGGALPVAFNVAGKVASGIASPIFAHARAMRDPEGFATSQLARIVHESGQTPQQIGQAVQEANAAGLPFTPADAMGNAGQKALAAVVRGPGQGSTDAVEFLNNRQAGQGRRVTNALSEGFDTRMTPQQLEGRMTQARDAQADADYGAVRNDASPVDVSNVLDHIDQHVAPLGVPHDRVSPDGITGRMLAYRRMLGGDATELDGSAAGGLNDFSAAQNVRSDLSDEIQKATRAGENNKARLLGGVLRQLDTSLENASPGFRQANADFRGASQDIEAIGEGRTAATRGRTEDTIPAFNALRPRGQQAFRTGYADPLIANTQGAAIGANKARPLMNDAFRDEAAVIAPRNAQMQRNIANENTMFETRARAVGGSKTAENLADDTAMTISPSLVHNVITGNWHGAVSNVLSAGHTAMTGNTPAVRAALGRMLLDRGVSPANLQAAIGETVARIQFIQNLSRNLGRGAAGAIAVNRPGQ